MKKIKLTRGKFATVDDDDFKFINQYKWHAHKHGNTFYAIRGEWVNGKVKSIRMHREIMKAKPGEIIDHKDCNGLNNQKSNLRFCTHSENMRNRTSHKNSTSKYLGVYFDKSRNKYRATIYINKKNVCLGRFDDEISAAKAYNHCALIQHGEFARLNKI